jgi:hypothetical protein
MGDILSPARVYRILAVLRRLSEWGLETFESWFRRRFFNLV